MPFVVMKDTSACPIDKPWAVKTQGSDGKGVGAPKGCHPSAAKARAQLRALYANVPEARAMEMAEAGTETGLTKDELRRIGGR